MLFCRFLKATFIFPKRFFVFSCLSLLLLSGCVSVPEQSKPWADGVTVGKLDNGLTYYLYDSEEQTDPFNIRLIVNAGSVDEATPSGVAHMVEHMVFRTTAAHPETLHQYFNSLGWATGKQVNAVTRESLTQFMLRTRVNDALDLPQSLALMADIAFGAQFTEQDWQKEQNIILEEWRRGENVAKRVSRLKKEQVRHGSRYVSRPTIGTRESILATTVADIAQFYKTFYVPANMSIVISGNIDKQQAVKSLEQHFSVKASAQKPARDYVELPLKKQFHIGSIQDPQGSSTATVLGFRSKLAEPSSFAAEEDHLIRYFLRKMIREQVIRDRKFYDQRKVSLHLKQPTNKRMVAAFVSSTKNHHQALKDISIERRRLLTYGLDDLELQAHKEKARAILQRQLDKGEDIRDYNGWEDKITNAVISNKILLNSRDKAQLQLDFIDKITIDKLNIRLRELLNADDQFLYLQFPGDVEKYQFSVTQVKAIQALTPKELSPPVAYTAPKKAPQPVLPPVNLPDMSEFAAGHIISKQQIAAIGDAPEITVWQLDNNDKVVWLNKPTANNQFYVNITTAAGYDNQQQSPSLSQLAVQLWQQTPPKGFTEQQWQQLPKWSWVYKADQLSIGAVVEEHEFTDLLKTYRLHIEQGQLDSQGFADTKQELIKFYDKQAKPNTSLKKIISQARFSADDLADTASDNIEGLTKASLESIAKGVLLQPVTIYVLGTQPTNSDELLTHLFASIKRTSALTPKPVLQQSGIKQLEVDFYTEPKSEVIREGFTSFTWTPESAFLVATLSEVTRQQLKQRLRYELSGVYNIDFSMKLDPLTNQVQQSLSFICAPNRREELVAAADDVLATMPEILKTLDLTQLKHNLVYAEKQRLAQSSTWLKRLELSMQRYDDARYLTHIRSLPSLVTNMSLASLAGKVLPVENQVTLVTKPIEVTE
ncbi:MAG: insulinase family protein [Pseudoalteromonas prydzensis]|uniref:M16 family metallopeptidase n=1 Tax=Pseudoalteromonas prydzensis TaxID=182141 RepID=UPI003F944702